MTEDAAVAALVYRGDVVESRHRAHVAVASATGDVVGRFGDATRVAFTRSSIKAYQLAPLVASGAADKLGFTDAELAVMCSSHSAEPFHLEAVAGVLERAGLAEDALLCGADAPYEPVDASVAPRPLAHNCSGKHANFLAQCVAGGHDVATYLDPAHPVQREVRALLARAAGVPEAAMPLATDGCSAPNYALPVAAGARLFATLARPELLREPYASALSRVRDAMMKHPEMVAGSRRFDTRLMESAEGRLAAKIGGEGVFGVADVESGLGLYVKVEDGNKRAVPPVVVEACRQLGWLEGRAFEVLGDDWRVPVTNARGLVVGRIEPVLRLEMSVPGPA